MYMLLNIEQENGILVDGTHIQWCSGCSLEEATKQARETERVNSGHISVAVVEELYDSYAMSRSFFGVKRLDGYMDGDYFRWQTLLFSDGSNPYICKTAEEFERVSRKYTMKKIKDGFWEVQNERKQN